MKRITAFAIAILGLVALTGCGVREGTESSENYPPTHYTFVQELPDGRSVLCVWAKSGYGAGLSCNWSGVTE